MSLLRFHIRVRGTIFVRNGAVTPGLSRECDITCFVKGQPKSGRQLRDSTVAVRRVQSVTVPSSRVSRECRSPGLRSHSGLQRMPSHSKSCGPLFTSLNMHTYLQVDLQNGTWVLPPLMRFPVNANMCTKLQNAVG